MDSARRSKGKFTMSTGDNHASVTLHDQTKGKLIDVASPQKSENSYNEEDVSIFADHTQQSVDSPLAIDIKLSHSLDGSSIENEQWNSYYENNKQSPTLTDQLREMSIRLKNFNSQPKSLCSFDTDVSCSKQSIVDNFEPQTPRFSICSKFDSDSIIESFATPQEKFKTRSTVLKKLLVDECLDFLNNASKEEIKQLKGIGEKRATSILELREENPELFKEIDDLKGLGLSSKQIKEMMSKILADI